MKIYLMRHFKVDFTWKKLYSSSDFSNACSTYDKRNIIPDSSTQLDMKYEDIHISGLRRTKDTAMALGLGTNLIKSNLLNEVPMTAFTRSKIVLPTALWLTIGRLQWALNSKKQPEKKYETDRRIEEFINLIESKNRDCLVIGHAFYFARLKKELKRRKYVGSSISYYKNGSIVEFKTK